MSSPIQVPQILQWDPGIVPWDPVPEWLLNRLDDRLVVELGKAQLEFQQTVFKARVDFAAHSAKILGKAGRARG